MHLATAEEEALRLVGMLKPYTVRTHIAGSVRRQKPEVKDIEIVCEVPMVPETGLLFADETTKKVRDPLFAKIVNSLGFIEMGNPALARYVKIQLPAGIKLDLFIPRSEDYFRQYAIRTGSAEYAHKHIAARWLRQGWCGCGDIGLRKQSDCIQKDNGKGAKFWICVNKNPTLPPVWQSEEEFFDWIGVKWIIPKNRNV